MKYSSSPQSIVDNINNKIILSENLDNNNVTLTTPTPYRGQYGPIKNPLFTNLRFSINPNVHSITHPKKA